MEMSVHITEELGQKVRPILATSDYLQNLVILWIWTYTNGCENIFCWRDTFKCSKGLVMVGLSVINKHYYFKQYSQPVSKYCKPHTRER
jgi:hypothetical protein